MLFIRGINTFGVKNSYHMLYIRTCSTKQLVLDLRVLYVFGSVHELEVLFNCKIIERYPLLF